MAHGLEGREPLVDHELVEFAQTLPSAMKIRGSTGKNILRQVLYRHVDRSLIERPKMGFSPPLDRWLANDMAPLVEDFLSEKRTKDVGIFKVSAVSEVRRAFAGRAKDNTQKLWNLVIFEQWRQRWKFSL